MVRSYEEELQHRRDLRKKYFEDPHYRRWSDIVPGEINGGQYAGYRDDRIFDYLITNQVARQSNLATLQAHLCNGHKLPINWSNFYAYFDEQLNDPENRHVDELTRMSFYDPSGRKFTAEMLLNKYRDEFCIPYDMI